jgi:hypothetical protein
MMGYWFVVSLIGIMPTWISSKFFRERRVFVSNSSNRDNIDNYINEGEGGGDQEGLLVIKFPSGFEVRNDRLYFSNNSNCAMLAYNLPSTLYKIISKRWG